MTEEDLSVVHWLANVDLLTVLCGEFREGDKFTLDERVLNCGKYAEVRRQKGTEDARSI